MFDRNIPQHLQRLIDVVVKRGSPHGEFFWEDNLGNRVVLDSAPWRIEPGDTVRVNVVRSLGGRVYGALPLTATALADGTEPLRRVMESLLASPVWVHRSSGGLTYRLGWLSGLAASRSPSGRFVRVLVGLNGLPMEHGEHLFTLAPAGIWYYWSTGLPTFELSGSDQWGSFTLRFGDR